MGFGTRGAGGAAERRDRRSARVAVNMNASSFAFASYAFGSIQVEKR